MVCISVYILREPFALIMDFGIFLKGSLGKCARSNILNETSKPPLNIFSNILTCMIHKWLQFTLNMDKSIKLNLSKFHFHKLK